MNEMRRCKFVTWILILSAVNFALEAPAPVRERLEISDVAEGWTATSQKRNDPLDDNRSTSTNAGDSPPPPTPGGAGGSTFNVQQTLAHVIIFIQYFSVEFRQELFKLFF
jgi:hypothetical protein